MSQEIEDNKRKILDRDHWHCQYPECGLAGTQLAHRISKGKYNKIGAQNYIEIKYGRKFSKKDIIHHEFNMITVCNIPSHNDHFNIGNDPVASEELLDRIFIDLTINGNKGVL